MESRVSKRLVFKLDLCQTQINPKDKSWKVSGTSLKQECPENSKKLRPQTIGHSYIFQGEVVLTFSPTVTSPPKNNKHIHCEQKGTGQSLRVKSKQVVPACLSLTSPLISFTLIYVLANFYGNDPMQTQKQLLTVTAQLQAKILTSISYQSKWRFGTDEILHANSNYLLNYTLFRTNKQLYPNCFLLFAQVS